MFDSVNFTACY